jgi:uncharacterized NAD(P)/FAD-binding protein YdhS
LALTAELNGGTWRDAVDGIRPHVRRLWRALPTAERARFLRHAATWWDVHRHRIPVQSQIKLDQAIIDGQLTIRKGAFQTALSRPAGGYSAYVRRFRSQEVDAITAARVIDCRGVRRDPELHASALVAGLLKQGAARIDPLRIGLDAAAPQVGNNQGLLSQLQPIKASPSQVINSNLQFQAYARG